MTMQKYGVIDPDVTPTPVPTGTEKQANTCKSGCCGKCQPPDLADSEIKRLADHARKQPGISQQR